MSQTSYNFTSLRLSMERIVLSAENGQDEAQLHRYESTSRSLLQWGSPILFIMGTLGNGLIAVVLLRRRSLSQATAALYLLAIAVLDTMVLYTGLMRYWIISLTDVDVRDLSTASCKMHTLMTYFSIHLEAWMLVSITLERVVAVKYPVRVKVWFTKHNVIIGMLATAAILLTFDLHLLWTATLVPGRRGNIISIDSSATNDTIEHSSCGATEQHKYFIVHMWPWLDMVVASLLPFLIIASSNMVIVVHIFYQSRAKQQQLHTKGQARFGTMTAMLVAMSIAFIIFTIPVCVFLVVRRAWNTRDDLDEARDSLFFHILNLWCYINNCANFFLYCMSGPKFRKELWHLLHSVYKRLLKCLGQ